MKREKIQSRPQGNRDVQWVPPSTLPEPPPNPDWVYRWIRVDTLGNADNRNVSIRYREGWEPCRAEDYPDIVNSLAPNKQRSARENSDQSTSNNIMIGGLMLCKMPREVADARNAYYQTLAERQLEAVDNDMLKELHPSMPVVRDRQSRAKWGKGSLRDD